ncbi:MAG: hypothetical protein KDD66_15135 [Bdellovibrionales bacterium]|nr:hypothetical protein [Bdellovibrionales bacterium]
MVNSASSCKNSSNHSSAKFLQICTLLSAWFPLLLAGALFFPTDPDLGYHLSIGRIVFESGFPHQDVFRSFSQVPEIAYSWLPDAVLWTAYNALGVNGLRLWVCSSLLLLAAVCSMLTLGIESNRKRWLVCFVLSVSLIQAALPRPRLWALTMFALFLLILTEQNCADRARKRTNFLLMVFVISAIWANIHISVFLAPVLAAVFAACRAIQGNSSSTADFTFAVAVSSLGAALSPYHFRLFSLIPTFAPGGQALVAENIIELQGLFALQWPWPVWAFAALILMAAWGAFAVASLRSSGLGGCAPHLVAAIFLLLTISASRHCGFFVIAAATSIAAGGVWTARACVSEAAVGMLVAAVAIAAGWTQSPKAEAWYQFDPRSDLPLAAMTSLGGEINRSAGTERLNILSPFGTGHFVTFWLRERNLEKRAAVFLDGRTDELGIHRFEVAEKAYGGESGLTILDDNAINAVIAKPDSLLFDALESSDKWRKLGGDERASVFIRAHN